MAQVTWYPYGNSRLQIVNTGPSPIEGEGTYPCTLSKNLESDFLDAPLSLEYPGDGAVGQFVIGHS